MLKKSRILSRKSLKNQGESCQKIKLLDHFWYPCTQGFPKNVAHVWCSMTFWKNHPTQKIVVVVVVGFLVRWKGLGHSFQKIYNIIYGLRTLWDAPERKSDSVTDQLTHQPTGLGSREERLPCGGSGLGTLTDYSSKNNSNIQNVCLKDGLAKKVSSHSHFSPSFKGDCRAVSKFKKNYFWNWNTIKALSQDMSWLCKIYWIIACNEVKFWDLQIWNTKKLYPKKCHGFAKYTESSRLTKWTVSIWFWARRYVILSIYSPI